MFAFPFDAMAAQLLYMMTSCRPSQYYILATTTKCLCTRWMVETCKARQEKDLGVYINTSMKFNKQCAESVKKANRVIGIIKRNFMNFDRSVILKLYKSLVRPHLDYAIPVWRPYLKKDITLLENVQRRMTKLVPKLRNKTYEERLKELKLMTLEQRHITQTRPVNFL